MKTFVKQPRDHLDYDIDLSDWLEKSDEIEAVDVTAPDGISLDQISVLPTRIKLWISGGTSGQTYKFSPLIHTESRSKEVDFIIVVAEE
jgi:hypothetical protein